MRGSNLTIPEIYTHYISNGHYQAMEAMKMTEICEQMEVYFELRGDVVKCNVLAKVRKRLREKRMQRIIDSPFWAMYYNKIAEENLASGNGKPDSITQVKKYFEEKGAVNPGEMAYCFWQVMESVGWKKKSGLPFKKWKLAANKWYVQVKGERKRDLQLLEA